jgi:LPXTG-motif cell wall-anchored protein
MKKLLFLLATMLLSIGIAAAQTDQTNPNANAANSSNNTQTTTTTTTHKHARANKKGNLPQTASPLPLLGLLGMGSLAAGVATRKKNRS